MTQLEELQVELAQAELNVLEATREVVSILQAKGAQRHEARVLICTYSGEYQERAMQAFEMAWPEGEGT